ncbi:MAG: DUF2341 domain-containing protein, partial [Euryarchaeota archaeon]|nr:DUF2341 domain-containing protein [Euryarchaeota archaeon]
MLLGTDSIAEVSFRGNRTADTGYKARMDARSGEGLSFLKPPYTVGVWQIIGTATGTACPTGWGTIKITVSGTSFTLEAFGQTKSITDFDYSAAGEISLQNHYGTSSRFDNVRVRKYASPTPSWNSFGNEESFPTSSNPVPSDGETNIAIPPDSFNITINDLNGDKMNITWRTNASGSWVTFNTTNGGGSGVGNGTYTATNTSWVDSHSTKFWWSVNLTDGTTWTNKTYNFTTSYQPQLSSPYPVNGSFSVLKPTCMIIASDQDKITVTVRFYENTTGSWVLQQTNNSVSVTNPVSVVWDNYSNATGYYVQYWWKVNVTDDKNVYNEKIYCFITSSDNPPELSNEKPTDQSKGILTNLNIINVTISDPDGDSMNWSIDTSPDIGSNSSNNVGNISISCNISGLIAGTTYYWYVNVTDGTMWINETYSFTTNNPPSITLITPSPNGTTGITTQPTCRMWANDTEGDTLNVTWSTNASGSWINKHTNISISANSTVSYKFTDFADYNKTYYWEVYVKDALSNISRWYYFTTKSIETSVDTISPYEVETFSSVIDATGSSDLDNVTLWYQYSSDNSSWNWWNLNWGYYKVFKISNANNSYQMQINVTKSSGGNVTCDGHCRDDFGDVRFIDVDNTTELDYWMESYVSGSYAIFWVETPSDIETDQNILMYYGNSGASSVSNG